MKKNKINEMRNTTKKKPNKPKKKNKYFTVLFLYNPEKRPFQLRISWLSIKAFAGLCLILLAFAGYSFISAALLRPVVAEKKNLEEELSQIKKEKEQIVTENIHLRQYTDKQGEELQELQQISDITRIEMRELNKREEEIRGKLGLEEPAASPSDAGDAGDAEDAGLISTNFYKTAMFPIENTSEVRKTLMLIRTDMYNQVKAYNQYEDTIESEEFKQEQREKESREFRGAISSYAMQFLGGRYAYGQNDPHRGVDCSGFTRYILGNYAGVYLNRTAAAQSKQGKAISIDNARPGDLLFYGNGGSVDHVAMYIGNGQVIHASNERNGIIVSSWNYRTPVAIRDVIGK